MATRSKGSAAFKRPGKRGGKGKHKRGDDAAAAKPRGNAAEQLQEQVARLEALGVETRPPPEVDEATDERRCKVWCAEEEAERIRAQDAVDATEGRESSRWPVYTRSEAFQGYVGYGQIPDLDAGRVHCVEFPVTLKRAFFDELKRSDDAVAAVREVERAAAAAKEDARREKARAKPRVKPRRR